MYSHFTGYLLLRFLLPHLLYQNFPPPRLGDVSLRGADDCYINLGCSGLLHTQPGKEVNFGASFWAWIT